MIVSRDNRLITLCIVIFTLLLYGEICLSFLFVVHGNAYTGYEVYSGKDKIVYADSYSDMRKIVISSLSKHKESITISYPGIAKDFIEFKKNNFMDFYDRLSFDNGYYTGILSGTCISINSSEETGIESVSLQFNYLTTKKQEKYISKKVKKIVKKYKGRSIYAKLKGAHDYLIATVNYDSSYYNPYYAFKKGKGICMSYALAYQRILQEMKIPCIYVKGKNHAWNMVRLDGKWYGVDVTWDDSGHTYRYFLKGTIDFRGHKLPKSGSHRLIRKARFSYK